MKEMFSPESPVMAALHRLMDLVEVNLAWALCCIPIVTIGASTVSLYGTIAAMQREQTNKEQAVDILPCFFSLFRREFRQSTLLMLIKALAILILAADARIAGLLSGSLANMVSIMFWIAAVPASMAGGFIYPVQAKFSNSVVQNAKKRGIDGIFKSFSQYFCGCAERDPFGTAVCCPEAVRAKQLFLAGCGNRWDSLDKLENASSRV